MKLTVEKITRQDKKKTGEPYVNAHGKPYAIYSIYANSKWHSCFETDWQKIIEFNKMQDVKPGDVIEVNVIENGKFLNIEAPQANKVNAQELMGMVEKMSKDIDKMLFILQGLDQRL